MSYMFKRPALTMAVRSHSSQTLKATSTMQNHLSRESEQDYSQTSYADKSGSTKNPNIRDDDELTQSCVG